MCQYAHVARIAVEWLNHGVLPLLRVMGIQIEMAVIGCKDANGDRP
jgi:hypothetical protein